jgi:hypothetical protein
MSTHQDDDGRGVHQHAVGADDVVRGDGPSDGRAARLRWTKRIAAESNPPLPFIARCFLCVWLCLFRALNHLRRGSRTSNKGLIFTQEHPTLRGHSFKGLSLLVWFDGSHGKNKKNCHKIKNGIWPLRDSSMDSCVGSSSENLVRRAQIFARGRSHKMLFGLSVCSPA